MCGIAGIVGKTSAPQLSEDVMSVLSKRGPDGHGMQSFGTCTFAHTRLSIVDLAGGAQPMTDPENRTAITFNGEIYNYKELRAELEAKGHRFSTRSDTEVILKAYAEFGESCVDHLDGQFAFGIWDEKTQSLFLARDRFGKKPLYYANRPDGNFVFSSEIKGLVAAGVEPKLDPAGIDAYLALMYIPPWRTAYVNVHTILPGHLGTYTNSELKTRQYWKLTPSVLDISYDDAKDEVRRLLTDAVRKRMVADVEVGSFLSGGVDSTLISAYAQQFMAHPLKTFALGYGDAINELPYAAEAAKKIGTDHYTLQASDELMPELRKVLAYFDEPHGDSADIAQHLVSELAGTKVKVALSGDGGDELFMGYGWYSSYFNRPKLITLKNALLTNQFAEHMKNVMVFPEHARDQLFTEKVPQRSALDTLIREYPGNGVGKINIYDLTTYLPGQLLSKVDQMSMMHSVEVRSPLLDHHLAEFVYSLPTEYKMNKSMGKIVLKDLLREIMPDSFVDRRKQGFGAPVRVWLSTKEMEAYVRTLFGRDARVYAFLRYDAVQKVIDSAYHGNHAKYMYRVWVLLCLEMWLREHESFIP
jgi:asparagine synthase (glutamine-hydrolysing)